MKTNLDHRKGNARISIRMPDGTPAANRSVRISQTRHKFLFGCGAFAALRAADPATGADERKMLEERLAKWLEIFNFGTLPFYWGRFEPERGQPHTLELQRAADWLNARHVVTKGHPLCWHTVCADWLMDLSVDQIIDEQLRRIERDVTGFKGKIDMWDVINEVVIMPIFDKYDNAVTRMCKQLGRVGMIKTVFAAAREANPSATLLLNDFNTSTNYEILIDGCLNAGVNIDAIGIQSHQHQGYWGLDKLHEVLDRFSVFGLPIHFTENTLISGDIMPAYIEDLNDWQVPSWPSTPEGEARQAREIAEMYTALFEHPLVEAITTWDHTDGAWLGAPSGVLRQDNSIKPAHEALHKLIKGDWWTDETLTTDEHGELSLTGFLGDYELSADGLCASFALEDASGTEHTVQLG